MSKSKRGKSTKTSIIQYECNNLSQEEMIEVHAEAYYRALKRIEDEKAKENEKVKENEVMVNKKYKWYENVFFMINVLLWPWKINKKFAIKEQIYDSVLVIFVSMFLHGVGVVAWAFGAFTLICELLKLVNINIGLNDDWAVGISISMLSLVVGSVFTLAGDAFRKETDSNKIYAYSASIIAMISCVISLIALIKM